MMHLVEWVVEFFVPLGTHLATMGEWTPTTSGNVHFRDAMFRAQHWSADASERQIACKYRLRNIRTGQTVIV